MFQFLLCLFLFGVFRLILVFDLVFHSHSVVFTATLIRFIHSVTFVTSLTVIFFHLFLSQKESIHLTEKDNESKLRSRERHPAQSIPKPSDRRIHRVNLKNIEKVSVFVGTILWVTDCSCLFAIRVPILFFGFEDSRI